MHKIKVRGIVKKDDKIFFVYVNKGGFYCLPGGTYEGGETFKNTLKREFIEELGMTPIIGDCLSIREFRNVKDELYLDIWFEIKNVNDFINIDNSKASHAFELGDYGFFGIDDFGEYDIKPNNIFDILKKNNINFLD